jgi:hypothetical protein
MMRNASLFVLDHLITFRIPIRVRSFTESPSIGGQISPARLYPYAKANLRRGL